MKLLILPISLLIFVVAVSATNYGYADVAVNPAPIYSYQPQVAKTYTYAKEAKVPVVETKVPITTSHVSGVVYEKSPVISTGYGNGRVKGEHTSIVVPVETGHKSVEQYVPVEKRYGSHHVPVVGAYESARPRPVKTKVEVETSYKSSDIHVPVHRSYQVPVQSYRSYQAPIHTSIPVQTYRSYQVPIQTSYRSIIAPVQPAYRSIITPVHTSYRSIATPIQTGYRSIYAPVQYGQKSIHAAPSVVGLRYNGWDY